MKIACHFYMKWNQTFLKEAPSNPVESAGREEQNLFLEELVADGTADDRKISWGGKLALENKNWELAEHFFSCLMERRSQPEDLLGIAQALFKQNRYKEAEDCLFSAMDQISEPCNLLFIIYKNLGDIYLTIGNLSLSEEFYNKAHTLFPQSMSLKFHKALLSLRQKHYFLAEKQFQSILLVEPEYVKSWLGLALARKFLKEEELAKACLYRCLDLDPQNKQALRLKKKWENQPLLPFMHQFTFST